MYIEQVCFLYTFNFLLKSSNAYLWVSKTHGLFQQASVSIDFIERYIFKNFNCALSSLQFRFTKTGKSWNHTYTKLLKDSLPHY